MNAKPEVKFTSAREPVAVGLSADLYGVKGHPRLGYERWVITSPVIAVRDGGRTIETMNTIYVQEE